MDGYLTKPVRLAQLKAAIDIWLRPVQPRSSEATVDVPAPNTTPPADLGVLAELVGNNTQVMQEVLDAFRANTSRSTLEFARAQADGAVPGVADIAHKLKSAARAIGAARLGQICADIEETAINTPRSAALQPLLAAFESELRAVHHFLQPRLDGHAGT